MMGDGRCLPPVSGRGAGAWGVGVVAPLYVLAILAVLYTLYAGRELLVPLTAAVLMTITLAPVVRALGRIGLAPAASAVLVIVLLLGGLGLGARALSDPIVEWTERLPSVMSQTEHRLRTLLRPVEEVNKVTKKVDDLARAATGKSEEPEVVVKSPSLAEWLFDSLRTIGAQLLIFLVLLLFLLAPREPWRRRLAALRPGPVGRRQVEAIVEAIEANVSRYLIAISLINLGLGACIALGLYLVGLPNPLLWGVMAAGLNYMPYIGVAVGAGIVGLVGLSSPDGVGTALSAMAVYFGLNLIESQLVTPAILGRRFALNPVVVFLSILFWGWLWSVPGALMAVPLLLILHAVLNGIEALAPMARFIAGGAACLPEEPVPAPGWLDRLVADDGAYVRLTRWLERRAP